MNASPQAARQRHELDRKLLFLRRFFPETALVVASVWTDPEWFSANRQDWEAVAGDQGGNAGERGSNRARIELRRQPGGRRRDPIGVTSALAAAARPRRGWYLPHENAQRTDTGKSEAIRKSCPFAAGFPCRRSGRERQSGVPRRGSASAQGTEDKSLPDRFCFRG